MSECSSLGRILLDSPVTRDATKGREDENHIEQSGVSEAGMNVVAELLESNPADAFSLEVRCISDHGGGCSSAD